MAALQQWATSFPPPLRPQMACVHSFEDELANSLHVWKFVAEEDIATIQAFSSHPWVREHFSGEQSWSNRIDFARMRLREYLEQQGINPAQLIAIGDNHNDTSMLCLASIAMANAESQVKRMADRVTSESNDKLGILDVLNTYFSISNAGACMHNFDHTFRLGLYEKAIPSTLAWEEKILSAKELGFDFIEISIDESDEKLQRLDWSDAEIYQLRHLCEKHSFPLQSMCLSAHRRFPFGSRDPAIRETAALIMQKAINLSYKLGIRCIQLAGYDVYYEPQSEETHQHFIQGMKAATKMAERAGVMLGVEIMDTPYLNSLSKFEVLKKMIPSPYFMAYPDVGNITGWNYDTCTELQLSADHIVQIHLKDTLKVSGNSQGQFRDLVIGEGEVDFAAIFKTLAKMGYSGPLVLEMWAKDAQWTNNLKIAKARLVTMGQQAGLSLA